MNKRESITSDLTLQGTVFEKQINVQKKKPKPHRATIVSEETKALCLRTLHRVEPIKKGSITSIEFPKK